MDHHHNDEQQLLGIAEEQDQEATEGGIVPYVFDELPTWLQQVCFTLREDSLILDESRCFTFDPRKLRSVDMVHAFCDALQQNTTLRELNLSWALIELTQEEHDHTILTEPISTAIQRHPSIEILRLSYNRLIDVSPLLSCLSCPKVSLLPSSTTSATLVILDLSRNKLNDTSAVALSQALETNQSLQTLYLEQNHIGDVGGVAIANALKKNSTLQTLILYNNLIGEKTSDAMVSMLEEEQQQERQPDQQHQQRRRRNNTTIKDLNLTFNALDDSKCRLLVHANQFGRYLLYPSYCKKKGKYPHDDKSQSTANMNDDAIENYYYDKLWPRIFEIVSTEVTTKTRTRICRRRYILSITRYDVIFYFLKQKANLFDYNGKERSDDGFPQ